MLLQFKVQNFRSLRDEQVLSLVGTKSLQDSAGDLITVPAIPDGICRCAGIFGANASGKSNLIKALDYLVSCVRHSHNHWDPNGGVPRQPFLLDDNRDTPSRFRIDLLIDNTRYEYGFTVDSSRVLEEYLDASVNGRWQKWFDRKAGQEITFGKKLTGENRLIERVTRPNSLFLSTAAQNNHDMLSPLFQWLTTKIAVLNLDREYLAQQTSRACALDREFKSQVLDLLARADVGIVDLEFKEDTATTTLYHKAPNGQQIPLDIHKESDGTVAYFGLLGPCVKTLRNGGVICIDELDASLHSLLAIQVVHLFNKASSNPGEAQLIFNSHDTNLLQRSILRRDQIWFTEKDDEGATHLYPLTDFKTRQHQDLERGYLQGRFGAVPFVDHNDFVAPATEVEG